MRYDLAFFLCCCKSFLGDNEAEESFYGILNIQHDATADEIKRAYKRLSLQLHPDKLAQRGKTPTEQDQLKFTRMKEAYETLSDPHKRETYDAIGERGLKWTEEPFAMDPQELMHNFAKSSVLDRSKIFAIFVVVAILVLMLPLLVCLHADGTFGDGASWIWTLTPLWIWNAFILFYHTRVIMMGPIHRPDHIPPEEWVDPLPMLKRYTSLARFLLVLSFEVLVAIKLDFPALLSWFAVFVPFFVWEFTTLIKKWPVSQMRIVTLQDLEIALGKPHQEFTQPEKELIQKRYTVVPSIESPEFEQASKVKSRSRHDMVVTIFRICFASLLMLELNDVLHMNWWVIFSPFWILSALLCMANLHAYLEVQQMAVAKDPNIFMTGDENNNNYNNGNSRSNGNGNSDTPEETNYGSVGDNGDATTTTPLTDDEREELKAQVLQSSSKLCNKCCSQGFTLILVIVFICKLQGADFSSLWILSPFLFGATIVLCCLGCAIFGITEVNTGDIEFDTQQQQQPATNDVEAPAAAPMGTHYSPPSNDNDNDDSTNSTLSQPPDYTAASADSQQQRQPQQQPVDLLDSSYNIQTSSLPAQQQQQNMATTTMTNPAVPPQQQSELDDLD